MKCCLNIVDERRIENTVIVTGLRRIQRSIKKHGLLLTVMLAMRLVKNFRLDIAAEVKVIWARLQSKEGKVTRIVQGNYMQLDLSDVGISKELFLTGVHELHSTLEFRRNLKSGMTVLEVGANIGYYALIATQHIGPDGKIVAIEPSPPNVQALRKNIELNNAQDMIHVHPYAAGREAGHLPFYIVSKSNLSSFINRESYGIRLMSIVDVMVLPVDEILERERLTIDYFRMDLEGFESEVIEGMANTLQSERPPRGGFIEVHSRILNENGYSARGFLERMKELGYAVKTARWRGREDIAVHSNIEFYAHPLSEEAHWETFFVRSS